MKKFAYVLMMVFVMAAFFAVPVFAQACDPADAGCVTEPAPSPTDFVLPSYLELLLAAGVGFLVTNGLKSFGLDVSGFPARITAGLVTAFVAFINTLLQYVPDAAREPVGVIFLLIASIFSAYGIHYSQKEKATFVSHK